MKRPWRWLLAVVATVLIEAASLQAGQQRIVTTTLLPTIESSQNPAERQKGLLWIQTREQKTVTLEFDLSRLPDGMREEDLLQGTLRLQAQTVVYKAPGNQYVGGGRVVVKGRLAGKEGGKSLLSLSTLTKANRIASQVSREKMFLKAVYKAYNESIPLRLELYSESHKASSLFYSTTNSGDTPTHLPRLVIQHTVRQPELMESLSWCQHQADAQHTGRSEWRPARPPVGFYLDRIPLPEMGGPPPTIVDYPLLYRGNLVLMAKVLGENHIVALDTRGRRLWQSAIGTGTVQRPPVISQDGIYYVVFEEKIVAYDLPAEGQQIHTYDLSQIPCGSLGQPAKLSNHTDLTVGIDGSLFLAIRACGNQYIYAFTPDLKPFLAAGPLSTERERISTVTIGPEGETLFAQTQKGGISIDLDAPSIIKTIALRHDGSSSHGYYHTPVAGPIEGAMLFSDFSRQENSGNVWGYTAGRLTFPSPGSIPSQPVLGDNQKVYFIQDGKLKCYQYDKKKGEKIKTPQGLNTTSNLVMDGGDNIYFWDNGYLHGLSSDGASLFDRIDMSDAGLIGDAGAPKSRQTGPEQFIRLMLAPDGTIWANNKNGSGLFAFRPRYATDDLTVTPNVIEDQAVYHAHGWLQVDRNVSLEKDQRIMMMGGKGIVFSRGFSVEKGATLLCRTGL